MVVKYYPAQDLEETVAGIITDLNMSHIRVKNVKCCRSTGSKAKRTLARIHALPRVWQETLNIQPHYLIEVLSERFDKLGEEDKLKTLIHELLHIPATFGGGFRHHGRLVNRRKVEELYKQLKGK
jgi:predicted metallopeptidase